MKRGRWAIKCLLHPKVACVASAELPFWWVWHLGPRNPPLSSLKLPGDPRHPQPGHRDQPPQHTCPLNSQVEPAELGKVKNSNQALLTPSQVESHWEASRMLASGDCACAEDEEGYCISSCSPVSPRVPISPPVTPPHRALQGP